ncbi:hypothetical protein Pcinc_023064 [Petrolisthes cinctipes]|uniref:Chitin-binding type-2 domain-containing protein n=1 Tax=Petrolisthes cinctipes TaxID=88211 RepID=A0AAE1FCR0_PETCI|nr:hypothetical protein Pcinc_023064 [Petrolisthes cinctipes]
MLWVLQCVVVEADQCNPTCEGVSPLTALPHPTDCHKYYLCLADGNPMEVDCEGEEFFYSDSTECVPEDTLGTCLDCPPSCRFVCPTSGTEIAFRADLTDCGIFYLCPDESPQSCTELEPYFTGTTCDADPQLCCDPCTPYCYEPNILIPDPTNCKQFYICTEKGPPPADTQICTDGNFDPSIGKCSPTAPCQEPCSSTNTTSSTVSTDTTSSTVTVTTSTTSTHPIDTTTTTPPTTTTTTTTTTPPTTTTTTTSSTTNPACSESWFCEEYGFFPVCTTLCSRRYFYCDYLHLHDYAEIQYCQGSDLLDPDEVVCVDPSDCPYPPE